jgi:hypothetical protein
MQELDAQAKTNNLIFMNRIGLGQGIDPHECHEVIDEIKEKGGEMILFESFCGAE